MKFYKFFLSLISICFFISCTNSPNTSNRKYQWLEMKGGETYLDLQEGDIIIKEKQNNILGIFGHSAIMYNDRIVYDYPKLGEQSYYIDINYWLEKNRKILILRYKDMTDEFKIRLKENMKKYLNRPYKINSDKTNDKSFYCSQYIWYIYYITAKELGYELDLDSNGGEFVFPYDFIDSPFLDIIYFNPKKV